MNRSRDVHLDRFMWMEGEALKLPTDDLRDVEGTIRVEDGLLLAQASQYEGKMYHPDTPPREEMSKELGSISLVHVLQLQAMMVSIRNASRQEHIQKWCPDDRQRRFKDYEATKQWAEEARTAIITFDPRGITRRIAGLVFFREKQHAHPDVTGEYTFGIRVYRDYLGKGLAKEFMKASHDWLFNRPLESSVLPGFGGEGSGVWLEVAVDNEPARKAYERFGYQEVAFDVLKNRVVMTYDRT